MNIYVGNLPYQLSDDELKAMFDEFGSVSSASVIRDKFTGRSRGFGFVEMAEGDNASNAIESMNGKNFGGRNLVVNEARPKEDRPRSDRGDSRDRGGDRRRS